MSKIGNYNLELQEQANDLGFSTVQEALDNGYTVEDANLVKEDEQEEAHKAWEKEKGEVLDGLREAFIELQSVETWKTEADSVSRAIAFIERGEM